MSSIITRFAPSPTGFLHIGGARTALFNYLFSKNQGGKFLLRIEDTDLERSTNEAKQAIIDGMKWLGIDWDNDIVYQSKNADRHVEIAGKLLADGKAYYCYSSPEELEVMREKARAEKKPIGYDGTWRDKNASDAPSDIKPVIRLKTKQEGETTIKDLVQGDITVANSQLDDLILLRADRTPTYNLAVVVDDFDMNVTHVIRGDDHINNMFRQKQIYDSLGWNAPEFAHVPLIHGADGAKLSKRHGALGVESYREMGYLSDAICNYLLRLGWSHGNDEIISKEQAIEWFTIKNIGKSASRFDFKKLENLNGHYMKRTDDSVLAENVLSIHKKDESKKNVSLDIMKSRLIAAMPSLKTRAKTLLQLDEMASNIYFYDGVKTLNKDAEEALNKDNGQEILKDLTLLLESVNNWTEENIKDKIKAYGEEKEIKLGKLASPIRIALTGTTNSPSVFEILAILGKDESLLRLQACL